MISTDTPIVAGMIVRHDEGLLYEIEDTRRSTVGYEQTHSVGNTMVNYKQLEDGSYPAGTKWVKDEEGFRSSFTVDTKIIPRTHT